MHLSAMQTLVFATANPNKVAEVRLLLGDAYDFRSLRDIGCTEAVPETQPTLIGNALQKAEYVAKHYGVDCFAEDSGLEVDALDGLPGVDTAHYAGPERDAVANMTKLLRALGDGEQRAAQFRAVIALVRGDERQTFEGVVRGRIAREMRGAGGFGYDPIFIPEGEECTFAELPAGFKKTYSHRSRAMRKLVAFLTDKPAEAG